MGLFDDLRGDIAQAKAARDTTTVEPAPRLDTLVTDPVSGEQRHRTDHAGTAWFGGRPQPGQMLVGGTSDIGTPFWLPDSRRYVPEATIVVQLQATASLQSAWVSSTGGQLQLFGAEAGLAAPAEGEPLAVYLTVSGRATLPLGVSYRVTVLSPVGVVVG